MKVALDLSSAKETPDQTNNKSFRHICKIPYVSIGHIESVEGVQDSMYRDRNEKIGIFFKLAEFLVIDQQLYFLLDTINFFFFFSVMGKAKRDQQKKATPYTRSKKKPITRSEKLKNENIIEDLDNNLEELTQHLRPKKKKPIQIRNESMEDVIIHY